MVCEYEDHGHGETVIIMGGRRSRQNPFHVSMHVEDEFGNGLRQRTNLNDNNSSSRHPLKSDLYHSSGKFVTPENKRLDDSGFPPSRDHEISPVVGSDPDWYLRPRKLLTSESRRYTKYDKRSSNSDLIVRRVKSIFGLGRPNYMYHGGSKWFLHTEAILGAIIFTIVVASLGFSALISARFFESNQGELNGKYKSLQYAKDQQDRNLPSIEPKIDNSKKIETAVEEPSHIPRDDVVEKDGGDYSKEQKTIPKATPVVVDPVQPLPNIIKPKPTEASKPTVLKVEAVQDNVKRNKRTKNQNPLTKSMKKSKITKVKVEESKENVEEKNFDYDDPSSFRGKNNDFDVVLDLLETDLSKQLL